MNYIVCILSLGLVIFIILILVYIFKKCPTTATTAAIENEEHFESKDEPTPYQENSDNYQSQSYSDISVNSKNKVLIISCYGYGNIGDNMYSEVFTKYLPECEIMKIPDQLAFVNSKKEIVKKLPKDNYPFDFLIIGGGGLITASILKNSHNMLYYINDAKKRNKPLFIISCGVQGSISNFKMDFSLWKSVLQYAKLVTVRSIKDKELLSLFVGDKVHYFRDLGYIFPHTIKPLRNSSKTITLIIAGPVDDHNQTIKKYIGDSNKNVVIMNMGSLKDDNNNKRMLKMDFPGSNVIKFYGSGRSPEFIPYDSVTVNQKEMEKILRTNPEIEKINPSDLTLDKVVNIIFNSEIVYTGRYHGMIFSRSLGVKYDTLGMGTNKMLWEQPSTDIKDMVFDSYNHIKFLRMYMGLRDTSVMDTNKLENSINSLYGLF